MGFFDSLVNSVTSSVGDLGQIGSDILGGDFSKLGTDAGKLVQDAGPAAMTAAAVFAPEMLLGTGSLGGASSILQMLGGLGGGAPAGALTGSPSPFSLGNLFPGALQDPTGILGNLFGGGGLPIGGSTSGGGLPGIGTGGFPGIGTNGLPDTNSYMNNMMQQLQGNLQFQQQLTAIQLAFDKASKCVEVVKNLGEKMISAA